MSQGITPLPTRPEGGIDKEAVRAMFMASQYLNWTEFAENQGWDALLTRRSLPVRTWIKEKRDFLAERHMDILSGLVHERKFRWTEEVVKTLDEYPKLIDQGMEVAKWKMAQIGDWAKDYFENFRGNPDKMYKKWGRGYKRILHPFEKLSPVEIGVLLKSLESLTNAKLKALMIDKWAMTKLDLPVEKEFADDAEGGQRAGPMFTIEGKEVIDANDLQSWFEKYHDKPTLPPEPVKEG